MIQSQLGWEDSESWTNHDFQTLSEKIAEKTGVTLSIATLKRIWGKVKYDSKPTITTLNTLAQFLGHQDWREFKQFVASTGEMFYTGTPGDIRNMAISEEERKLLKQYKFAQKAVRVSAIAGVCMLVVLLIGIAATSIYDVKKENADYQFSSKKVVSEGVPNSVIFDYDATAAPTDSVYIQQSWDERLRTKVSKNEHQHTSIYYAPGFFKAKLVVNDQVVKEHNLWITSNGWLALVKQDPIPQYFENSDFRRSGMLSLPLQKLIDKNISFQPEAPWTSYYNVKDFGSIKTDNFSFETEVRSDYKEGSGVCQHVQILLLTEGNVIILPLSVKGCVSDLNLFFGDAYEGKKNDLSAFGCDISNWVKLRCSVKDKVGKILLNDKLVFENKYEGSEKIVGLIFRFQGTGSINQVSLAGADGQKVLNDTF